MTFWLWVLIAVLAAVALAGAAWFYFLFREDSIATVDAAGAAPADAADDPAADLPATDTPAVEDRAADEPAPDAAEAGDTLPAAGDDPVAAFGLDPEEWAPMSPRTYRKGRLRGLLRGGRRLAALAGEPDALFEHRDGGLLVGYDADRPYAGRPQWAEVSALTLQMGLAALRWPGAGVSGTIRYRDRGVPVAYSPELFADLRAAARRGGTLPGPAELQGGGGSGQPA